MSSRDVVSNRVVIAVDPHKASWTAAVVNCSLQPLATLRVPVSAEGYQQLRRFASRWPQASWAIEGAGGLGAPLAIRLCGEGIAVVDVPAKLAARVRLLSTGHGRKNDDADATSVGIAALTAAGLPTFAPNETTIALRVLVEHRDDLVKTRTQTINRLHGLLTQLVPGGAPPRLGADTAAQLLPSVRPADPTAADPASFGQRPDHRNPPARSTHYRDWHRDHRRCPSQRQYPDRPARHRRPAGRQNPRPGRRHQPIPLRGGICLLHRHRPDRGVLR